MKKSTGILLAVLLIAALVAGGVLLSQKTDLQKQVDDLTAQVTTLTAELETAKKDAATAAEEAAAAAEEAEARKKQAEEAAKAAEGTAEIAMVTDIGTIDDKSFNQGTWEGIKQYAEANGKTFHYYQPTGQSTEIYLDYIEQAVNGGAKVVVTPGFLFEAPIYFAQDMYPDVHFILIDGNPNDGNWEQEGGAKYRTEQNAVGIVFAEEEAGFLAGYAAVKDGYKKLGFMGGLAVPAVVRFGYGFVQGIDYAAKEMGLTDLTVNYQYVNSFLPTPEVQNAAAAWYADGIEVIFACAGGAGNSVMAAAQAANGKVIGVDVDQSGESETVITSATKGLAAAVVKALGEYYEGKFPGGQAVVMDAKLDGVGLPMATSRFTTFTQADYDAVFKKLVDGEVKLQKDSDVASVNEITVENVKVTEFK